MDKEIALLVLVILTFGLAAFFYASETLRAKHGEHYGSLGVTMGCIFAAILMPVFFFGIDRQVLGSLIYALSAASPILVIGIVAQDCSDRAKRRQDRRLMSIKI